MTTTNRHFHQPIRPGLRRTLAGLLCTTALGLAGGLSVPGSAGAGSLDLGDGWTATTLIDLSAGAAMRTRNPDPNLVARGNGGIADGTTTDDGDLNFKRGDLTSAIGKVLGEVDVSRDGLGVFLRGKAIPPTATSAARPSTTPTSIACPSSRAPNCWTPTPTAISTWATPCRSGSRPAATW